METAAEGEGSQTIWTKLWILILVVKTTLFKNLVPSYLVTLQLLILAAPTAFLPLTYLSTTKRFPATPLPYKI
jgi:hypothetical protein